MAKHFFDIIETRGLTYRSRRWWQARSIAYHILRILRIRVTGIKVARMMFRSTYRGVTYSEDAVDRDFASSDDWQILEPASSPDSIIFMVLARKSSQRLQGKEVMHESIQSLD